MSLPDHPLLTRKRALDVQIDAYSNDPDRDEALIDHYCDLTMQALDLWGQYLRSTV